MVNKFGVMQGRLLKKYNGRFQAHPKGYWEQEFFIAEKLGLDCIEFILDFNDAEENPLLNNKGLNQILKITKNTGVDVSSVCADYFMEAPLHSNDKLISSIGQKIFTRLIKNAKELGVKDIVLPCVDQSSLNSKEIKDRFIEKLSPILDLAEKQSVNISLETDLPPLEFRALLDSFNSNRLTVNYDIGNSASLGYDPVEELNAYGSRITDIHIKDRLFGKGSVILGQGDACFASFFNKLKEFDFKGPFIMQAYRDEEGIDIFKKQVAYIKPYLADF